MTEVARRQASRQRTRIDGALLERRRHAALATLGELVYELASSGQLELEDLPELSQALDEVEAIEQRIADVDGQGAPQGRSPRDAWAGMARSSGGDRSATAPQREPSNVWRPPRDPAPDAIDATLEETSSRRQRPTEVDSPRKRAARGGGGGIAFVEDDGPPAAVDPDHDLADYMHADDVPGRPKPPPGGPTDE